MSNKQRFITEVVVLLLLGAAVLARTASSQQPNKDAGTIRARKIEVVDKDGKVQAVIGEGGTIRVQKIEIIDKDGVDKEGKVQAVIGEGGTIRVQKTEVVDKDGKVQAVIAAWSQPFPGLGIFRPGSEESIAQIGIDPKQNVSFFINNGGLPVCGLTIHSDGSPLLMVKDPRTGGWGLLGPGAMSVGVQGRMESAGMSILSDGGASMYVKNRRGVLRGTRIDGDE